jgi:hypothetical protein
MDYFIGFSMKNNSNSDICFYVSSGSYVYPDTTISFDREKVGYTTKPNTTNTSWSIPIYSYEIWISGFPKDTVSIYIFSQDTVNIYEWEIIQQDYKILQRYDLSLEDINNLKNENDIPVITYPPSEAMKNMKMYPPYE